MSYMIFIPILFIEICSEDTFNCSNFEDNSLHPLYHKNDCRHYWHCIHVGTEYMRAVKRICPAGTEFNARIKKCEISSLVCIDVFFFFIVVELYSCTFERICIGKLFA